MSNSVPQVFTKAMGHSLQKVMAAVHAFKEKLGDPPICLWLFFEGLPAFRLFGSSDGWHIQVDETPPEPTDLGESGEMVLRDISRKSVFRQALGKTLKGGWTIESPAEGGVIGVRFDFGLSLRPIVLNWGDELYVADQYPPDAKGEGLLEAPMKRVKRGSDST